MLRWTIFLIKVLVILTVILKQWFILDLQNRPKSTILDTTFSTLFLFGFSLDLYLNFTYIWILDRFANSLAWNHIFLSDFCQ